LSRKTQQLLRTTECTCFIFIFPFITDSKSGKKKWQVSKGESTWKTVLIKIQLLSRIQLPVNKTLLFHLDNTVSSTLFLYKGTSRIYIWAICSLLFADSCQYANL